MEKEVLGMKQKREHSSGARLGCKQGRLKWRVLILGGEDVGLVVKNDEFHWLSWYIFIPPAKMALYVWRNKDLY